MVKIVVNGETLKLLPDQSIRFKFRNPLMYEDVLPKTYTLPFKIPLFYGTNARALGYPQNWQLRTQLNTKIDCLVYLYQENEPHQALMNFHDITDDYAEVDIIIDKSVDDLGDTNIRDIDMGTYELDDTVKPSKELRVLSGGGYSAFLAGGGLIELSINEQIFSATATSQVNATLCAIMHDDLVTAINGGQSAVVASRLGSTLGDIRIRLEAANAGTDNDFTLDNVVELIKEFDNTDIYFWDFYEETTWMDDQIDAIIAKVEYLNANEDPSTVPVVFPKVKNPKFYSDETLFGGYQNDDLEDTLSDKNEVRFITPMPSLVYVMKEVFEYLGYYAYGSFLDDVDVLQMILYSNVAADHWTHLYGTSIDTNYPPGPTPVDSYDFDKEVNVHASVVTIARHCPDMTVKEFLTAMRTAFNLKYDYNPVSRKVEVYIATTKTAEQIQAAPDYSNRMVLNWRLQNSNDTGRQTIKVLRFMNDSADEKQKEPLDYQQERIVDPLGKKSIEPKMASIGEEMVGRVMIASLSQSGVYNGQGTPTKLKMLQYFGNKNVGPTDTGTSYALSQDTYTMFTRVSTWTLSWHGEKGLYERCWEKHMLILNEGKQLRIFMTFDLGDLPDMEHRPFHFLDGSLAIWKDIDIELGAHPLRQADCIYQLL